jgi:hypothetical protein
MVICEARRSNILSALLPGPSSTRPFVYLCLLTKELFNKSGMFQNLTQGFLRAAEIPQERPCLGRMPLGISSWSVRLCILLGTAILVYGASLLVIICSFLALGHAIAWYHPLIALVMTSLFLWHGIGVYFGSGKVLASVVIAACLVVLAWFSLASSQRMFDHSWDGQTYHAEAVFKLSEGWNPFYEALPQGPAYWSSHLPFHSRGPWYHAAALYKLTGQFSQAKAFNGLYLFASFFLSVAALSTFRGLSGWWVVLLSALLALNPVTVSQWFTMYVDGQLASLITSFLALAILIYRYGHSTLMLGFIAAIILVLNVKLTGVVYAGILTAGYVLWSLPQSRKVRTKRILVSIIGGYALGIVFVGYSPYVTRSPSEWATFQKFLLADVERNSPTGFGEMNGFETFLKSAFSKPQILPHPTPQWKVPFSTSMAELREFRAADVRVAGWGPIFGETMALALIALILLIVAHWRRVRMSGVLGWLCVLIFVSVSANPYAWWARFSPQLWVVPILITVWILYVARNAWLRRVAYLLALLLCINAGSVLAVNMATALIGKAMIESQLSALLVGAREGPIAVALNGWVAVRLRLIENGVRYVEVASSEQLPCEKAQQNRIFSWAGADYCGEEQPGLKELVERHRSVFLISLIDLARGR